MIFGLAFLCSISLARRRCCLPRPRDCRSGGPGPGMNAIGDGPKSCLEGARVLTGETPLQRPEGNNLSGKLTPAASIDRTARRCSADAGSSRDAATHRGSDELPQLSAVLLRAAATQADAGGRSPAARERAGRDHGGAAGGAWSGAGWLGMGSDIPEPRIAANN